MIKNNTEFILNFNYNSINVERVISTNQIKEWVELEIEMLMNRIEEYVRSSDLIFQKFTLLSVQFSYTRKVRGGSYIKLPDKIQLTRSCVNIKNNDNKCLLWCLLAYKYYDKINNKDKNEVYNYRKYENEIILPKDFQYPASIKDISKIEKLNNLKCNVFSLDKGKLQTIYNTKERNDNVVNLLLLRTGLIKKNVNDN